MGFRVLTLEQRERIRYLYRAHAASQQVLAQMFKVSKATIWKVLSTKG